MRQKCKSKILFHWNKQFLEILPENARFCHFQRFCHAGKFRNFPLEFSTRENAAQPCTGGGDTFAYLPFPPDYGPVIKRMNIRLHSFPIKGLSSIQSAKWSGSDQIWGVGGRLGLGAGKLHNYGGRAAGCGDWPPSSTLALKKYTFS